MTSTKASHSEMPVVPSLSLLSNARTINHAKETPVQSITMSIVDECAKHHVIDLHWLE